MPIIVDKLVRSGRRTIALIVERDGTLTVRAPLHMSALRIQAFVEEHSDWILKNKEKVKHAVSPARDRFEDGQLFLFLGQAYPLKIVSSRRRRLEFDGKVFKLAQSALPRAEEAFIDFYKDQAKAFIGRRALMLAEINGFRYKRIRISSARTRWGSCSTSGTLSFTYRLVMAPPDVVDYVVIHELVHTKIHNHSRNFWNNVALLVPDYKVKMAWLKKNGPDLV
jgi:predicted metal-dependent hydrolase